MTDDELRQRLAAANPTPPSESVDPITSDRARTQMETIMSTTAPAPAAPRNYRLLGAIAVVLVTVIGGIGWLGGTGTSNGPLVLTADGSDALASCLPFEVATLAGMAPAFAGTVVELTDSVATLEVDRWFTDGNAEVAEISYTPGFEALIGTPALETGQRYLITATDGVVNGCGYSGIATPEYEAQWEQAFGA